MLTIQKVDLDLIFQHCDREYPNEACGVLAGNAGKVNKVFSLASDMPSPQFYRIDSKEHFRVLREMREQGLELVGIYHSHPSVGAYPSGQDVELAFYTEAVYMIVSLLDRKNPVVRGYRIVTGDITEVLLDITTEAR
jgi:proteasome lid subunit RPN8/RPN11